MGLSPHIRGNAAAAPGLPFPKGSIPAHTGERRSERPRHPHCRVYPRTYGGTRNLRACTIRLPGLSPHIRGNGMDLGEIRGNRGSIPAHTGERDLQLVRLAERRVYPRTYGGTRGNHDPAFHPWGLSPHIRGNDKPKGRVNPALLSPHIRGNVIRISTGVYPRTYGGTPNGAARAHANWGLSPHIRGNGSRPHQARGAGGSIPAHTGERIAGVTHCG